MKTVNQLRAQHRRAQMRAAAMYFREWISPGGCSGIFPFSQRMEIAAGSIRNAIAWRNMAQDMEQRKEAA